MGTIFLILINKVCGKAKANRNHDSLLVGVQNALWKPVWQFLTKLCILLTYDPVITFLGIYPKEFKTYVYTKPFLWMFIAALFIIVKTWKHIRCPSTGKWIKRLIQPDNQIFVVVLSLSHVWFFVTPWTAAHQASLSFTISRSLLKLMSFEPVMLFNHLIICCPRLLLPSILPSIRVFSSELTFCIRWTKYWSFSFSISPFNEYSGWFLLGLTGLISL